MPGLPPVLGRHGVCPPAGTALGSQTGIRRRSRPRRRSPWRGDRRRAGCVCSAAPAAPGLLLSAAPAAPGLLLSAAPAGVLRLVGNDIHGNGPRVFGGRFFVENGADHGGGDRDERSPKCRYIVSFVKRRRDVRRKRRTYGEGCRPGVFPGRFSLVTVFPGAGTAWKRVARCEAGAVRLSCDAPRASCPASWRAGPGSGIWRTGACPFCSRTWNGILPDSGRGWQDASWSTP